jgi:hypothetical protein
MSIRKFIVIISIAGASLVAAAGCGGDMPSFGPPPSDGGMQDAGVPDAGMPDAGMPDGGVPPQPPPQPPPSPPPPPPYLKSPGSTGR